MLKNFNVSNLAKQFFKLKRLLFSYKEQKMDINGKNINVIQAGEGKKTVFLLPGTMGTARTHFAPQLESLPDLLQDHKIISWDPPGYGKSVPPEREFNTECFKNDAKCIVELMRKLSIDRTSLLGWSAGATTAIIIAGKYPELVEKLVIWGAFAQFNKQDFEKIQAFRDVGNLSQRERETYERVYGEQRFLDMWDKNIDTFCAFYKDHKGDICREEAKKIKAPTFILHGKKDIASSENSLHFLFDNLPCYKYFEFPEGKHNIHLRYCDKFNEMVADFLLRDSKQLEKELKKPISTTLNPK